MWPASKEDVEDLFGQHKMTDEQFAEFQKIKNRFQDLATEVFGRIPEGHLRTKAIEFLFMAKNHATMAYLTDIVRKERHVPEGSC